jgi:hypothetical protein
MKQVNPVHDSHIRLISVIRGLLFSSILRDLVPALQYRVD